ncbi:F-box associated domain containing protein [Tanacetum coccineum]
MFLGTRPQSLLLSLSNLLEDEVCTLSSGQWRRLGHVPYCINRSNGLFINGYVHWIVSDKHSPKKLYSFNIDNETFELFPSPPFIEIKDDDFHYQNLGILNGCLSLCDSFSSELELTVWVMKEYGLKKSWCKEVVIKRGIIPYVGWLLNASVYLIESLDDGTILMLANERTSLVYCPQKKTIEKRAFHQP